MSPEEGRAVALAVDKPTIGAVEAVPRCGLMSYGSSPADEFREAARYVDRILKGAKPADLPAVQPTRYYLTVNRNTATTLGLAMPPALLLRTDEVVE